MSKIKFFHPIEVRYGDLDPLPKTHLRSYAGSHRHSHSVPFFADRSAVRLPPKRSGVDFEKLSDNRRGEASDDIRARVEAARQRQR